MISRQSKCFSILPALLVLFSQFVCVPAFARGSGKLRAGVPAAGAAILII